MSFFFLRMWNQNSIRLRVDKAISSIISGKGRLQARGSDLNRYCQLSLRLSDDLQTGGIFVRMCNQKLCQ